MDDTIRRALDQGHRIDITTIGRRTGAPRRIELVFHNLDGRIVISGMPFAGRTRAWIYNLEADPRITIHLKGPLAHADLRDGPRDHRPEPSAARCSPAWRATGAGRISTRWSRTAR